MSSVPYNEGNPSLAGWPISWSELSIKCGPWPREDLLRGMRRSKGVFNWDFPVRKNGTVPLERLRQMLESAGRGIETLQPMEAGILIRTHLKFPPHATGGAGSVLRLSSSATLGSLLN